MKRHAKQRDLSTLQSTCSINKLESPRNDSPRRRSIEKWISALPEPMHRVKKLPKITSMTPSPPPNIQTTKSTKLDYGDEKTLKGTSTERDFKHMVFASVLYGMTVENLDKEIEMFMDNSNDDNTQIVELSDNLCNMALHPEHCDLLTKSMETDSSWESTDSEDNLDVFNLVEYPAGVVIFGVEFKENPIEAVFDRGECSFKVLILEVVPPLKFWFINDRVRKILRSKLIDMKKVYDAMGPDEFKMAHTHVFPRQICAVPFGVGWARGIIRSYLLGSKINVFLVDFGMEVQLSPNALKYLKTEFMEFPRLAMRGTLANVKKKERKPWHPGAKNYFCELMCCTAKMAKLVEIKKAGCKHVFHLEIIKRSTGVNIADILVDKGFIEHKKKFTEMFAM